MENVYVLEDRGHQWIYHWLIFMLGGLCDLEEKNIPKPIKIHTYTQIEIQKELLELLKPDFVYVEDISNYNRINNYGAPAIKADIVDDKYYKFLREKILINNNLENHNAPKKLLYISRNTSHELKCNNGVVKRQLLNEDEVYKVLEKQGFEYIKLEKYNLLEKIKLFQDAKMIVTPNGGALTFSLFANQNTQIIEIHDPKSTNEDQYYNICIKCNIPIDRYINVSSYDKSNRPTWPGVCREYSLKVNDIDDFKNFIEKRLT